MTSPAVCNPTPHVAADNRHSALSVGKKISQNCPFPLRFRHPAGGGPSHGHRQHALKIGKVRACGSGYILANRQTDRQTDVIITILRNSDCVFGMRHFIFNFYRTLSNDNRALPNIYKTRQSKIADFVPVRASRLPTGAATCRTRSNIRNLIDSVPVSLLCEDMTSSRVTLNRIPMKVYRTTLMDVIAECRHWFGLLEMEMLIAKRKQRFMAKYVQSDNVLCQLFAHVESV